MRRNGFVFVELYVEDPPAYVAIFGALGFAVSRDEGDFVELRSARGIVLLNRFDDPEAGHPFESYRASPVRGLGVEIGIVVDDVRAAWKKAAALPGCRVSEVVDQEWGMTDFRIVTPHGYYVRVTTGEADDERAGS